MQDLIYDTPIEVTQAQYNVLMNRCSSMVAGRVDESGKCFIKIWLEMDYVKQVLNEIK